MRRSSLSGLGASSLLWLLVAPAVAQIVPVDQFRRVAVEAEFDGYTYGHAFDAAEQTSSDEGAFEHALVAAADRFDDGGTSASATQRSAVGFDSLAASGSAYALAAAYDGGEGGSFGASEYAVRFTVPAAGDYLFVAMIEYVNPALCRVWLRDLAGQTDLFLLEGGSGNSGDEVSGQVRLLPGVDYEIRAAVECLAAVEGQFMSDEQSASYAVSLAPVPAAPTLALAAPCLLVGARRRRRLR